MEVAASGTAARGGRRRPSLCCGVYWAAPRVARRSLDFCEAGCVLFALICARRRRLALLSAPALDQTGCRSDFGSCFVPIRRRANHTGPNLRSAAAPDLFFAESSTGRGAPVVK